VLAERLGPLSFPGLCCCWSLRAISCRVPSGSRAFRVVAFDSVFPKALGLSPLGAPCRDGHGPRLTGLLTPPKNAGCRPHHQRRFGFRTAYTSPFPLLMGRCEVSRGHHRPPSCPPSSAKHARSPDRLTAPSCRRPLYEATLSATPGRVRQDRTPPLGILRDYPWLTPSSPFPCGSALVAPYWARDFRTGSQPARVGYSPLTSQQCLGACCDELGSRDCSSRSG